MFLTSAGFQSYTVVCSSCFFNAIERSYSVMDDQKNNLENQLFLIDTDSYYMQKETRNIQHGPIELEREVT